jgi:mercuric ion binding protein
MTVGLLAGFAISSPAWAEVTVTVSKTHLCCGACVKAVDKALGDVQGVKHKSDQSAGTITLNADNNESAQRAIDALAVAGFYGKLDSKDVKYKAVDVTKEKVTRLELTGIHNCCGQCTRAIKSAIKEVEGVKSDNVKAKSDSFVVEGDFSAAALVESLLNAGFQVQVKK